MPGEVRLHAFGNLIIARRPPEMRVATEVCNRHRRIARHAAAHFLIRRRAHFGRWRHHRLDRVDAVERGVADTDDFYAG